MGMFGKTDPAPEAVESTWGGPRFEVHVETFMRMESDKLVAKRLNELGAQGWEPAGVLEKAIGMIRSKGDEAWSIVLRRRVG